MKTIRTIKIHVVFTVIFLIGISAIVDAEVNPIPVSRWTFDETAGIIANDIIDGNQATLLNGAFFTQGLIGNAVYLDGIDDRVEVSSSPNLMITNQVTVEALVNIQAATTNTSAFPTIVAKWGNGTFGTGGYGLFIAPDGVTPVFAISRDGFEAGYSSSVLAPTPLSFNQWHHLVGTYDGVYQKLYIDGILVAQATRPGTIFPTPAPVVMGQYNPEFTSPEAAAVMRMAGLIDYAAIYNVALDATTVQQLAQSVLNPQGQQLAICQNNLAVAEQQIESLQTQLVSASNTIQSLQNQVNSLQNQLNALTEQNAQLQQTINDLQNQIAQVTTLLVSGLISLQNDFRVMFNDPTFVIPGATPLEQYQNLVTAILQLNKGRKEGIYTNLGGKPGK